MRQNAVTSLSNSAEDIFCALLAFFAFVFVSTAAIGPFLLINNLRYPLMALVVCYLLARYFCREWLWQRELATVLAHPKFPFYLFGIASFVFFRIKYQEFVGFQVSGVDFSHIDYAIWSTLHGDFMNVPIAKNPTFLNHFGNHYAPVLFLFVATRFFWDHPLNSLFVHAISLSAAVIPIYYLAKHYLEQKQAAVVCLIYLFLGATASTLQFDIHQESFYPLAFSCLFLSLLQKNSPKNYLYITLSALFCLSIKEDTGLYISAVGVIGFFLFPQKKIPCAILSIFGASATFYMLRVLMPAHQPEVMPQQTYYISMWAKYGHNMKEIIISMLAHPHWVLEDVFLNKAFYKQLYPFVLLPFLSPFFLMALAPIVVAATSASAAHHFGLYYGAVLIPFFLLAMLDALKRIQKYRVHFIWPLLCVSLAVSAFVGGAFLRFPPAHKNISLIEITNRSLKKVEGEVFVQGGLLPYALPYSGKIRRLENWPIPETAGAIYLSKEHSMAPMAVSYDHIFSQLKASGRIKLVQQLGSIQLFFLK